MHQYEAKTFSIPELTGISQKQIDVHLGLYQGYVKNIDLLREQIADLTKQDAEKYTFAIESIRRRMGFEFNGMRMHEFYFPQLEGGPRAFDLDSPLATALSEKYGDWNACISHLKKVALSRGSGWCSLVWDAAAQTPHVYWTTDHELGSLVDVNILFALDMWEHAYMVDYLPAEKATHVDAYLANVNWEIVARRFPKETYTRTQQ